jgi:hypothetical protein
VATASYSFQQSLSPTPSNPVEKNKGKTGRDLKGSISSAKIHRSPASKNKNRLEPIPAPFPMRKFASTGVLTNV